jgi:hypothetical protein
VLSTASLRYSPAYWANEMRVAYDPKLISALEPSQLTAVTENPL